MLGDKAPMNHGIFTIIISISRSKQQPHQKTTGDRIHVSTKI